MSEAQEQENQDLSGEETDDSSTDSENEEYTTDIGKNIQQFPSDTIPAAGYMIGKEQIFGIPQLSLLPPRYRNAENSQTFDLEDYIVDCCCCLAPEDMFHNWSARHVLAKIAAGKFVKNLHIFMNLKDKKKGFVIYYTYFSFFHQKNYHLMDLQAKNTK